MIDSLVKSGPEASVNIVADDGKTYALRLSLNGFAGAHDAMAALAKQKASRRRSRRPRPQPRRQEEIGTDKPVQ